MSIGEQVDFFIDGLKLKRVERFKHLGRYVTKDCKMKRKQLGFRLHHVQWGDLGIGFSTAG